VDLRGHGLSEVQTVGEFSMDLFADDIARTLDVIGADQIDLAGLSMGGYVLFAFWRRHADRVRSLIFIDTKAEADSAEGKAGREKTAELVAAQGMEPLWLQLETKMFGSNPSLDVKERVHQMFLNTAPEVAAADALAMRDRPDSTQDLGTITVPTLWLQGEEDGLMPVDPARAAAERIAGATFVPIPKGGHLSTMENPEAVNQAITEFLKR
jgi:pimeloyl-ACP methyl ester carboxylesterase